MKRAVTFYYNEETGELAKVDFSEAFKNESALMRADVMGDIRNIVDKDYEESVDDAEDELVEDTGASSEAVRFALSQLGHTA